ncbi:MAG TPA: uracil phosphoribosyltransferase [Phycisphaerae bacterium]|jgi:uracil phosphoribosyltransferase
MNRLSAPLTPARSTGLHPNVTVIAHPLIQQKLTLARDRRTGVEQFRRLVGEIARLMVFEVCHDIPTQDVVVETPLAPCAGRRLAVEITLVPILRAGLGLAEGILELIPDARLGHLGVYRDEDTLEPVSYYSKLPPNVAQTDVVVLDPMLATGGSASAAITIIKRTGAKRIRFLCLVAAPEGIAAVTSTHPDVAIYTAAIDDHLNEKGYIVPGLGDAGDRLFGTH